VADVTSPLGLGTQVRLIAALRWRMLRNSLRRRNAKWDLVGTIFSGVIGTIFALGVSAAFSAGAYFLVKNQRPEWLALLFWIILVFWQIFPIFVAGFGQHFAFRNLLRFPLDLGSFYVVSLAYGLADFTALSSVCWLVAIIAGATKAQHGLLPALVVIGFIFLVMNVALERLTGSLLERLLARRRTRELLFALVIALSVGAQFAAQAIDRWGRSAAPWVKWMLPYFAVFPPGLAGRAAGAAAAGNYAAVLANVGGLAIYALVIGGLLWLRLAAQYGGEELSETAAPAASRATDARAVIEYAGKDFLWLSPPVGAVLRKEFNYLRRNSLVFLNLFVPPLVLLLVTSNLSSVARRHPGQMAQWTSSDLFMPGMLAYLILILTAPAYNCFAYEGHGIKTYFTSPVRFRDVFAGKNLLLVIVLSLELGLCLVMLTRKLGAPTLPKLIATLIAVVFSVSGQLIVANWSSLGFPRKLEYGSMRNQRASGMAVLLAFGTQILLAGISSVIFLAGRWMENPWLPVGVFAVLAVAALGGYFSSLDALSELAEKKREVLIDALCR